MLVVGESCIFINWLIINFGNYVMLCCIVWYDVDYVI